MDWFYPENRPGASGGGSVLPTAGAIPVRNEKGQVSMQKVKVTRYVAGQRPIFAERDEISSDSDADDVPFEKVKREQKESSHKSTTEKEVEKVAANDPRWRRLQQFKKDKDTEQSDRKSRHRRVREPEVVTSAVKEEDDDDDDEDDSGYERSGRDRRRRHRSPESADEPEDVDDVSDEEFERRRTLLRQRAKQRQQQEEELLTRQQDEQDDADESEDEQSSEYEEYTDSEDESAPRLKPVFVPKRDRVTLQDTEKEQLRLKHLQLEQKRAVEDRKKQSAKLVEDLVKREIDMEKRQKEDNYDLESVVTDDENEELSYEAWKVRELKRIKRDKEEREQLAKEKAELERIHNMTEEERRAWARSNPKIVTNKQEKGKYKFLQKYYHRGAFFLDQEDDVYKQNFAESTLEDKFDKTILPKVMQVKDFGKAGRTKWTHLVAEDTTDFQSAWVAESAQSIKFFNKHAGGVKDVFERPAAKKKKAT